MSIVNTIGRVAAASAMCVAASAALAGGDKSPSEADIAAGAAVYNGTCIACHGADGRGAVPGAPDFTKPNGVLSLADEVLEDRVIHGFSSPDSPMAMPADGGDPSLTEDDVRHVIEYMRHTFKH